MDNININRGADVSAKLLPASDRSRESDYFENMRDKAEISPGGKKRSEEFISPKVLNKRLTGATEVKEQGEPDHVVEATDATFDQMINNGTTPVFVDFYSPT